MSLHAKMCRFTTFLSRSDNSFVDSLSASRASFFLSDGLANETNTTISICTTLTKKQRTKCTFSFETHCPGGFSEECESGQSCYGGLKCNVQDLVEEAAKEEEAAGGNATTATPISKHDPKRHNFCGTSWGDANEKCSIW